MVMLEIEVLLVIPVITTFGTLAVSLHEGAEFAFVSVTMNFERWEPWGIWFARYLIWHLTFFRIFFFKLRIFPQSIQWLAYFNSVAFLLTIWSGFKQVDDAGYEGSWRQYTHWITSGVVLFLFAIETPALWRPYIAMVVIYILTFVLAQFGHFPDTGILFIGEHVEIPGEYVVLGSHLYIVWGRYKLCF